ncbi:MAG: DUF3106 domain-containing protein [Ruminococcaceae bacterium]|nr:DUF3106 domain-containing protein [Oscillospiraceae bacterium]
MICPKCSSLIDDELLTCPECNEQIATNAQKDKINAAYEVSKGIVKKRVQARIFLATTIFMTIMLALQAAAIASTVGAGILFWLLPCIFAGISMAAGYKLYSQKKEIDITSSLVKFSRFDACSKVYCKVMAIVGIVAGVAGAITSLILPFLTFWFNGKNYENEIDPMAAKMKDLTEAGFNTTVGVAAILGAAVVVVMFLLFKAVFEDRQRAFNNVTIASATGEYTPVSKSTFTLSYVVAGFVIFFGVLFIAAPIVVSVIADMLPDIIQVLIALIIAAGSVIGLFFIALGVYLILSAKWLADTQKELLVNNASIAYELDALDKIYDAITEQKFQKEKEEKEAEIAAAIAKEEERLAHERERLDNEFAARAEMRAFVTELMAESNRNNMQFWATIQTMKEDDQRTYAELLETFKTMKEEEQAKNDALAETFKAIKEEEQNTYNQLMETFQAMKEEEQAKNAEMMEAFMAMKEEEQQANLEFWNAFKTMQEEDQKVKAELIEKYAIVEEQMKFLQQVVMQQMIGANMSNNNNNNNNNANGNQNPTIITTTPLVNPYVVPQVTPVAPVTPVYAAPAPQYVQQPAPAPASNPNPTEKA